MWELRVSETTLGKAREDGNKIIKNDNATITYGGIVTGALGTRVVADWLGVELEDSVQYDMIDGWLNKTIEVKTKQRKAAPQPHYEASVTTQSLHLLNPDIFVFVSLLGHRRAYIMGAIEANEFYEKALPLKQGDYDPSNGYTVKKDCLNIAYSELGDYDKVATARR